MKKTAALIYDKFCNFEFSVALEILAMAGKPIEVFAKNLDPVRSEEGLRVVADKTIDELNIEEYDSLILTGSLDLREAFDDEDVLNFIRQFHREDIIIGAISIAPIFLLRLGILKGKPFMVGLNKEDLFEEGFTPEDMKFMVGWNDNLSNPVEEGYIRTGNVITSVSYEFIRWAIAFGRAIGIEVYPKSFGVDI